MPKSGHSDSNPSLFHFAGSELPFLSVPCLEIRIFDQTSYETAGKSGSCSLFLIITSHLSYQLLLWLLVLWVKYFSCLPWFVLQISSFTFFIIKAVLENDMFTSVLQIQYIYTVEISRVGFLNYLHLILMDLLPSKCFMGADVSSTISLFQKWCIVTTVKRTNCYCKHFLKKLLSAQITLFRECAASRSNDKQWAKGLSRLHGSECKETPLHFKIRLRPSALSDVQLSLCPPLPSWHALNACPDPSYNFSWLPGL